MYLDFMEKNTSEVLYIILFCPFGSLIFLKMKFRGNLYTSLYLNYCNYGNYCNYFSFQNRYESEKRIGLKD